MPSAATTTVLRTSPASPVRVGTLVTLTAAVTPVLAVGTVQFKDGTTPLGPRVAVANGIASGTTSRLTAGSHQLTAAFIPADSAAFLASTSSPVELVVGPGPPPAAVARSAG